MREKFLSMKQGDIIIIKNIKYIKVGMFLMELYGNDLLMVGIDF